MHTSGELFDLMFQAFSQHNMEQAEAETAAIMAELLNCNRLQAKLDRSCQVEDQLFERGREIIRRRLNDEPWQYIFNRAYFRDLELYVDPSVLIPRPETELLAGWCIEHLENGGSLLDVGTGSGAIALAVQQERSDAQVTACDISSGALNVAKHNAELARLTAVRFVQSNLLSSFSTEKFHIIAANLPYVTNDEYAVLPQEVRNFEPQIALTAGDNGLALIKELILQAPGFLHDNGKIILEMAPQQTDAVAEILRCAECFGNADTICDYTGRKRFVTASLSQN